MRETDINPILKCDYPDPDVIRVGDTYYMASTTMHFLPGGALLKSYDLIHWELASYIYDTLDETPEEILKNINLTIDEHFVAITGPNGGGKSTLAKYSKELGLAKFSKMDADSKRNRDNRFSFQNIKETTDVALIDDLKNNIDLSYLYDRISGDFNVEEKHKPMKSIPFKDAPTIVATTNSMPIVEDSSTKDRILFVPVFTFFHVSAPNNRFTDTRRISDFFGFRLFEEGHTNAMRLDDLNLIFQAIQYIMSRPAGSKKIDPPMEEINQRMRVSRIGTGFNNWLINLLETDFKNNTIYISNLKDLYYKEFNKTIDTETLHKKIITFAKIHENEYTLNPGEKDPENVRKTMAGRKQYVFRFVKNKNLKSA